MLNEISTIELKGANFHTSRRLSLLSKDGIPVKATLVYGRNGSGKSTIAKGFRKLKGEAVPSVQLVSAIDVHNEVVALSEEDQNHIFIFDEDYVNKNVRIQEDGLGSIVMLGEQVGLMDLITSTINDLKTAEADRNQRKLLADEYADAENEKSPKYYIEKMKSVLKGNQSWAERDKRIKGNAVNTGVSENTYRNFIELEPTKTRDELIVEFYNRLKELEEAKSGASKIVLTVPVIPDAFDGFNIEKGNRLLKKVIEHPELSDREQYLLGLVQSGKGAELRTTVKEFQSPNLDRCPKCHQPLSEEYKCNLIASIQKVLSDEVDDHQRLIVENELPMLEIDLSAFQQLAHYQDCVMAIETVNLIIQSNNALLESKVADPYTPVYKDLLNMGDALESLRNALQQLENDRVSYNRAIDNTRPIKSTLTRINNEIAYYDVIDLFCTYNQRMNEKQEVDQAYAVASRVVEETQARIDELNAHRDSIHIAIDIINDGLKYIFFSENRMKIQVNDGVYKLFCNGYEVRPKDVSVGERNIIGLCYFFASILKGKNRADAYSEPYLLIIDDPVSSFDLENKIGILSFLKYQIGKFFLGDINTRALIMTHDLLTAIDVDKMLDELIKACKAKFNGQHDFSYTLYELSDGNISRFEKNRNEYTELLKLIYEYGNGGIGEQGVYIGNIMRQVLEAFATFEYKKGIADVSTDDAILAVMDREEDRIHYKDLMYRIVLNEGSHRLNQTRNMRMDFFAMISEPEKRRTAKEILCFMYLLNKPHMKAHLGEQKTNVIEVWCEEIRG